MADLQTVNGSKFDAADMHDMVQGHEIPSSGSKPEKAKALPEPVEAVVAATLPILEQHLALAQAVESEVKSQAPASRCKRALLGQQR